MDTHYSASLNTTPEGSLSPLRLAGLSPDEVARAVEAAIGAYYLQLSQLPGGRREERPDLSSYITGLPMALFNGVVRAGFLSERLDDQIGAALQPFVERGLPMAWHIGPSSQPELLGWRLPAYGLRLHDRQTGMAADLDSLDLEQPALPGLKIVRAASLKGLQEFVRLLTYRSAPQFSSTCLAAFALLGFTSRQAMRCYTARLNGQPVATAALFLSGGVASLQMVQTLPGFRRRGIGTALSLALMQQARASGYHTMALAASTLGLDMYAHLGFAPCCTLTIYTLGAGTDDD
jgi:GNAT superfamily N-acetyltransferase